MGPGVRWTAPIVATLLACAVLAAGCGSSGSHSQVIRKTGWVDQPVSFRVGGITVYATYRHPASPGASFPAALLIAGSGPTDRNGNSSEDSGTIGTIQAIADWLSADGVASLRYDKLGSGQTGLGSYAADPASIGISPFEQESAAALDFLAGRSGVNRARLMVIGHSEGALFALLLAAGVAGPAPHVAAVGLFEPLGERYLDVIAVQVEGQIDAAEKAGSINSTEAASQTSALESAVTSLRQTGRVPSGLPADLSGVFNPSTALFLSQADRYDPAALAAKLAARTPVLVTCSNADQQVTCPEVDHLVGGLTSARADTDFVHLVGVDHVLKQDPTGSPGNFTSDLPFSAQLRGALGVFVHRRLAP